MDGARTGSALPASPGRPPPDRRILATALIVGAVVAGVVVAAASAGVFGGVFAGSGRDDGRAGALLVAAVLSRAAIDAAAVACVGLALIALLLGPARGRPTAAADRALLVTAGGWAVLVLLGIAVRAADTLGRALPELTADQVVAWSTRLTTGRGMLAAGCCAVVVLGAAAVRLRRRDAVHPILPLAVAVIGCLAPAVTGHAGAVADPQLGLLATAVHVAAAALWVGGLGALLVLVAPHRQLLDAVLPRYSAVATGCLVLLTAGGIGVAAIRLGGWDALTDPGYGRLVLVKAVLLGAAGVLGWLARRRLHTGRRPVLRWAGIEVAVLAVAVGVASTLAQTPPPGAAAAHDHDHDAGPPAAAVDLWVTRLDPLGTVVVDGSYRILYRSDADSDQPPTSTCADPACTATWEPVRTDQRAAVGHGVAQDLIGTLVRTDGTRQVTLAGWPLYRRVGEVGGSPAVGTEGVDGRFAVGPDGARAVGG